MRLVEKESNSDSATISVLFDFGELFIMKKAGPTGLEISDLKTRSFSETTLAVTVLVQTRDQLAWTEFRL